MNEMDEEHLECFTAYKDTHVCIAVLTGRGSGSLSSVFISNGCTPLRLTPYATHTRLVHYKPDATNIHTTLYAH